MARKQLMPDATQPDSEGSRLLIFSLNETSVGRNGNNRKRSDVQLTQFFLKNFYELHPELFVKLPKTPSRANTIKIDGVCGSQTIAAIEEFQRFVVKSRLSSRIDGVVNVATTANLSPLSHTTYTIFHLNSTFANRGRGREFHNHLEDHPDIISSAPELQAELKRAEVADSF